MLNCSNFKTDFRLLCHINSLAALKLYLECQKYIDQFGKMGGTFQNRAQIYLSQNLNKKKYSRNTIWYHFYHYFGLNLPEKIFINCQHANETFSYTTETSTLLDKVGLNSSSVPGKQLFWDYLSPISTIWSYHSVQIAMTRTSFLFPYFD